jgi:hypothetical protein
MIKRFTVTFKNNFVNRGDDASYYLISPAISNGLSFNKKLKKEGEINSIKRTVTPNSRYAADGLSVIA